MAKQQPQAMNGAEEEAEAKREVVRFMNAQHFETRVISPEDWKKVGVDGPVISWDPANEFMVSTDEFGFLTKEQFAKYILADPRLERVLV